MRRPFAELNLKGNPFGELTDEDTAAVAVVDLDPIRDALDQGLSVQVLGPCGHGKSTHLKALAAQTEGAFYTRVWSPAFTGNRFPRSPDCPNVMSLLVLDETDQLYAWQRIALMRRAERVVCSTHRSVTKSLRLAGHRSIIHPIAQVPSRAWLRTVVQRRVEHFANGRGSPPVVPDSQLDHLIAVHQAHIRGMEVDLYDWFQALAHRRSTR